MKTMNLHEAQNNLSLSLWLIAFQQVALQNWVCCLGNVCPAPLGDTGGMFVPRAPGAQQANSK